MAESEQFDAITRRVDLLREQAAIAAAKEKEAFYNFKRNRWEAIVNISKEILKFGLYSVMIISFFGSICFGCYTCNNVATEDEILAKAGFRRVIAQDVKDRYGNPVWKVEKIPDHD